VSDTNPLDRTKTEQEKLLKAYRKRFGDDPPYLRFQGAELLEAVKEALEKNRPIPFEVPDKGFA